MRPQFPPEHSAYNLYFYTPHHSDHTKLTGMLFIQRNQRVQVVYHPRVCHFRSFTSSSSTLTNHSAGFAKHCCMFLGRVLFRETLLRNKIVAQHFRSHAKLLLRNTVSETMLCNIVSRVFLALEIQTWSALSNVTVSYNLGDSDHKMVLFSKNFDYQLSTKSRLTRNFSHGNMTRLRLILYAGRSCM